MALPAHNELRARVRAVDAAHVQALLERLGLVERIEQLAHGLRQLVGMALRAEVLLVAVVEDHAFATVDDELLAQLDDGLLAPRDNGHLLDEQKADVLEVVLLTDGDVRQLIETVEKRRPVLGERPEARDVARILPLLLVEELPLRVGRERRLRDEARATLILQQPDVSGPPIMNENCSSKTLTSIS